MTRVGDIATPAVTPHPVGPDAPIYRWPYRPVVALERLPQAAYTWDDADLDVTWDDTTPERVWDAAFVGSGFTDAVCDFHTIDIDPGDADGLYLFPSTSCTITLANPHGEYTPWTADGRLTYWAPGRRVAVWVTKGAASWWLFSGRVASWTVNADDTVTVVAWDGLSWLAQELGGPWTPGAAGQTPKARITAIAAAAAYPDRLDLDVGDVTLTTSAVTQAPLDMIERVALSDGGLFYGDADGSLDYRDRTWRAGRSDQTRTFVVSDNVCNADVVVWDPVMAADDERLATDVRLVNEAALAATATLTGSIWAGDARYRLSHPDPDLWTTQQQGNTLAAYLLAQQSTPSMAVGSFELYVLDPHQPAAWDLAVQTRRGDRLEYLHGFVDAAGQPSTLDLFAVVLGVAHNITPDEWRSTVALSRTVDYRTYELWDRTVFAWDRVDPLNVWRF